MLSIPKNSNFNFLFCIKSHLLVFWFILFVFTDHSSAKNKEIANETFLARYTSNQQDLITKKINSLSLENKIGQLFIYGFSGQKMNRRLKTLLTQYTPGSIIVFKRNIKSLNAIYTLNSQMHDLSKKHTGLPLFIMVDQEGGNVSRLILNPRPPSALAIGQSKNLLFAKQYGQLTGELLYITGFNFNLAPVVDLSNPDVKNFIGSRSFGNNPGHVFQFAKEFSSGLISYSVLPTFKHFPGHGNLDQDSHKITPKKNMTLRQLMKSDLVPFTNLAKSKFPSAIMTSHISFPKIDKSKTPATYSRVLLTDLLRNKLEYDGLIITDDLQMNGARDGGTIGSRAVKAINAGCDLLMVAWSYKKQIQAQQAVLQAVKTGQISEQRINTSLYRILRVKLNQEPMQFYAKSAFNQKVAQLKLEIKNFGQRLSSYNLRNQQNNKKLYLDPKKELHVFSSTNELLKPIKGSISNPIKFYKLARNKKIPIQKILNKSKNSVGVFYISGEGTARILNSLPENTKARLIVINASYPGVIKKSKFYGLFENQGSLSIVGAWLKNNIVTTSNREIAGDSEI